MKKTISYRINYEKAIESVVWLAGKKPGIDIYHIAKVLFYADKIHINRYARPVLGDTYTCMDYGPAPSGVQDLINENSWLSPDYLQKVSKSIKIKKRPHSTIKAIRKPDWKYFSKTDLECLEESLKKYGEMSFEDLKILTHNEKCWIESETNQPIDYALFIDDDNPHRKEILEEISQTAAYVQV